MENHGKTKTRRYAFQGSVQQFMDMDGNREYIRNQAFDARYMERYRKAMQTVYLPKNAEKLKMMMEKKFDYWIEYKDGKKQVEHFGFRSVCA